MTDKKRDEALQRAIDLAGGVAALARFINQNAAEEERLTTQAISQWVRCPQLRVLLVEKATADATGLPRVTRHELRPDIYPDERSAELAELHRHQQQLDLVTAK